MIPADLSVLVGKVRKLCRVKSIRIAASAVMDKLKWPYLTWASFVLENALQRKCMCWMYRKGTGKACVNHKEMVVGK